MEKIYSSPFCTIKYPAIQWFQISINHNILVTNKLLVKMKLQDNPYCYNCHSQEETITHLLWTCDKIQQFLSELSQCLRYCNIYCEITKELYIFGLNKKRAISKPLNIILLYAKYYIYILRGTRNLSFVIRRSLLRTLGQFGFLL